MTWIFCDILKQMADKCRPFLQDMLEQLIHQEFHGKDNNNNNNKFIYIVLDLQLTHVISLALYNTRI